MSDAAPKISDAAACSACGGTLEVFYRASGVPVNSCILLDSDEEARAYPRGDIALGFCKDCGFILNTAFEQRLAEYSGRYEETQSFSPTFSSFHKALAERLIERHQLRGKDIVEIGCGKGDFLRMLCELGGNRGVGFDPSYVEGRQDSDALERIRFIPDFYSEAYASHEADFVCCKMTLEHIHATRDFTTMVRRALESQSQTIVFFQVPEAKRILGDCAFEDIYYEHCSYFSAGSLARLFRRVGFEVLDVSTEYDDQYLTIEARPAGANTGEPLDAERDLEELRRLVAAFPAKFRQKTGLWSERLAEYRKQGRRVVLWGSGSKAVSFLTSLEGTDVVEHAVDINPFRQGHYMPLTAQRIVSPDDLETYKPDVVIIMNRIYTSEITRDLEARGLSPEVHAL